MSADSLITLHKWAAGLHLTQGVALATVIGQQDASERFQWPLTQSGYEEILTDKTTRFDMAPLVPMFSFLSGINHTLSVTFPGWYKEILRNRVNPIRWAEFSASSTLMLFQLAVLAGVTEVGSLINLVTLNVVLMYMGFVLETRKAQGAKTPELIALMIVAWGIFMAQWAQIILSFFTILNDAEAKPPDFVYSIIMIELALFASFGILQVLYVFDRIDFFQYEKGFIVLSFVAKSLLAWLLVGGVFNAGPPSEEQP